MFAAAVLALIVVVASESAKSSAPDRVDGVLASTTSMVSGSDVWCAWSNRMPSVSQQGLSNLEGSAEHVEMHIQLRNHEPRPLSVSIEPRYDIGAKAHADSSFQGHVRTIPADTTVSWYLNAGTPRGVPTDARIATCDPSVRSVSAR